MLKTSFEKNKKPSPQEKSVLLEKGETEDGLEMRLKIALNKHILSPK